MADTRASRSKTEGSQEHASRDRSREVAPSGPEVEGPQQALEPLLGGDFGQAAFHRHAAMLGDGRLSHPANAGQRAAVVQRLQRDYGNRYVQRLVEHVSRTRSAPYSGELHTPAEHGVHQRGIAVQRQEATATEEADTEQTSTEQASIDPTTWNRLHSTANSYVTSVYAHLRVLGADMAFAYWDAWGNYQKTLKEVRERRMMMAMIATTIFSAALAGAAGPWLKTIFQKSLTNQYLLEGATAVSQELIKMPISQMANVEKLPNLSIEPARYYATIQQRVDKEESNTAQVLEQAGLNPDYTVDPYQVVTSRLTIDGIDPRNFSIDKEKLSVRFETMLWEDWIGAFGMQQQPVTMYSYGGKEFDIPKEVAERLDELGISESQARAWAKKGS